jgi:hypothetical protein
MTQNILKQSLNTLLSIFMHFTIFFEDFMVFYTHLKSFKISKIMSSYIKVDENYFKNTFIQLILIIKI